LFLLDSYSNAALTEKTGSLVSASMPHGNEGIANWSWDQPRSP